MLESYLPVMVILLLSVFIGSAIIVLSDLLSKKNPTAIKLMPYECGMDPIGGARQRFSVKFFIFGMLFIVFDVELIFMFPWANIYDKLMFFGFVEMLIFVLALLAGLVYVWKKGALQWE